MAAWPGRDHRAATALGLFLSAPLVDDKLKRPDKGSERILWRGPTGCGCCESRGNSSNQGPHDSVRADRQWLDAPTAARHEGQRLHFWLESHVPHTLQAWGVDAIG